MSTLKVSAYVPFAAPVADMTACVVVVVVVERDGLVNPPLEAARRAQPDRAAVYKELGRAHMRAGHLSQARSAYQRYLELAPDADDRAIVERLLEGR